MKRTGYSMSLCVADILKGKVSPQDVEKIIASTRIRDLKKGIKKLYRLKEKSGKSWLETIDETKAKNQNKENYLYELTYVLLDYKKYYWQEYEWEQIMKLLRDIKFKQPRLNMDKYAPYPRTWDSIWYPPLE